MDSNRTHLELFAFPNSFLHDKLGYRKVVSLTTEKTMKRTTATLTWHPVSWLSFIWRLTLMITSKHARENNTFQVFQTTGIYLGQVNKELEAIAETPDNCIEKEWVKIHTPHKLGVSEWSFLSTKISIEKDSDLGRKWIDYSQRQAPLTVIVSIDPQGKNLEVLEITIPKLVPIRVDQTLTVMLQNLYPILLVADTIELEKFWYKNQSELKIENGIREAAIDYLHPTT